MRITPELVFTLKRVKNFDTRTILQITESIKEPTETLDQLYEHIISLEGRNFASIDRDTLYLMNFQAKLLLSSSEKHGIGAITYYDASYPVGLKDCRDANGQPDPPLLLFYRGNLQALEKPGIVFVGTKNPTENGEKAARYFAK